MFNLNKGGALIRQPVNNVLFHDDVDGIISASIFLYANKDANYRLYPVSSSLRGEKFSTLFHSIPRHKTSKRIILDYQYEKDSDLWIDHHFNPEFGESAIKNENIIYDPKAKSATCLVANYIKQSKSGLLTSFDLWMADMIDSGEYNSVEQIFRDKNPMMRLRAYLEKVYHATSEMACCRIVEVIANSNMNIEEALFKLKIGTYYVTELEKNALQIKDSIVVVKNISIVRQKRMNQFPRYSEYFVLPDIKYSLRITPVGNKNIYIQLGFNNWQKKSNKFNIGKMFTEMQDKYIIHGGGHFNVGAASLKEENLEQFIDKITETLNEEDSMEKYAVDSTDPIEQKANEMIKEGSAKTIAEAREKSSIQIPLEGSNGPSDSGEKEIQ